MSEEKKKAYKPRTPFRCVEGVGSLAWRRLSPNAIFVLMELYKKFSGRNRYDLSLTYSEIKEKLSNRPFQGAIWELIGFGFIDVRRWGALMRNCSLYGLSDRWRNLSLDVKKLDEIQGALKQFKRLSREKSSLNKRTEVNKLKRKLLPIKEE